MRCTIYSVPAMWIERASCGWLSKVVSSYTCASSTGTGRPDSRNSSRNSGHERGLKKMYARG